MSVSRVRENLTHGSRRRRGETHASRQTPRGVRRPPPTLPCAPSSAPNGTGGDADRRGGFSSCVTEAFDTPFENLVEALVSGLVLLPVQEGLREGDEHAGVAFSVG